MLFLEIDEVQASRICLLDARMLEEIWTVKQAARVVEPRTRQPRQVPSSRFEAAVRCALEPRTDIEAQTDKGMHATTGRGAAERKAASISSKSEPRWIHLLVGVGLPALRHRKSLCMADFVYGLGRTGAWRTAFCSRINLQIWH